MGTLTGDPLQANWIGFTMGVLVACALAIAAAFYFDPSIASYGQGVMTEART